MMSTDLFDAKALMVVLRNARLAPTWRGRQAT